MKEIVIISGKGGTGKTSIAASFGVLGGKDVILADCDVDAADMHLLLEPDFENGEDFYSGKLAVIDQEKCTSCGDCGEICRFDAIRVQDGKYSVDPLNCEGCGYCSKICPEQAIEDIEQHVGRSFISAIKTGSIMAHAKLKIGADNSGKFVAKVKNEAQRIAREKNADMIIVDGSPGVGCPVVSSLSGADYVVLVTEPSISGLHDLRRIHALVKKFKIKSGCIINKHDLNPHISEAIREFMSEESIDFIAEIPYDEVFTQAMIQGKTMAEYDDKAMQQLMNFCWEKVNYYVNQVKQKK
ncbi:MAG: ATP-binding protein [Bacteroidales bacterium]|nr:ATP-binding protein [Bacteroidales bacterium]MCF8388246.1 ATP-binding protein [Bacteroidales bacterium]MCF8398990.1 ATP-binding protein [Bacteroidales bacterium]